MFCAVITDNSSVNTCRARGEQDIITMTEVAGGSYKVSPGLQTIGKIKHNDDVKGDLTTAHPVVYPNGQMYNLYTNVSQNDHQKSLQAWPLAFISIYKPISISTKSRTTPSNLTVTDRFQESKWDGSSTTWIIAATKISAIMTNLF